MMKCAGAGADSAGSALTARPHLQREGKTVPANRSRTNEWRRCLQQLHERNGSMEIALIRDGDDDSRHLLWRVRVLGLASNEIIVEQPTAMGRAIELHDNVELAAIFAIGQNRWMFRTTKLGSLEFTLNDSRSVSALRLAVPDNVERCQRRHFYRIETTALNLPQVEMWPLLDPKSVVLAERACEIELNGLKYDSDEPDGDEAPLSMSDTVLPEVGPKFMAELANIGGGGVGIRVAAHHAPTLGRHKLFWLRFTLPPEMTTPVCATGKLTHSHMDSTQHTYGGLAFDFSFNPGHQEFVVEQICRYIAAQQREQIRRLRMLAGDEDADDQRRIA